MDLLIKDWQSPDLVVNSVVQIFDENVALPSLTQGGVTLRPHYAAGCDNELNAEEFDTNINADHARPLIKE